MTYFTKAFTVLSLTLSLATVRGNEVGSVHSEHSSGSTSTDEVKKELKEMLKGKSDTDIMELRKELVRQKKEHASHEHHDGKGGHPKCPLHFGSQRSDGCCASTQADDLKTAKYQCQTSTEEHGKATWEVFVGGANSKFQCCPKQEDAKETLEKDLAELKHLVAEKEKMHKDHDHSKMDVDWKKEEDTTEEEMQNQLHLDGKKLHQALKDKIGKHQPNKEMEKRMKEEEEKFRKMREQYSDKAHEDAAHAARKHAVRNSSFVMFLELIPVVGIIGFGLYYLLNEAKNGQVVIPGHGTIDLGRQLQDIQAALFPAYRKFQTTTYSFDKSSQETNSMGFGAYGGGGYGAGSGLSNPVYESEKLAHGFAPISSGNGFAPISSGNGFSPIPSGTQAVRAAPRTSLRNFGASPEEDMGL